MSSPTDELRSAVRDALSDTTLQDSDSGIIVTNGGSKQAVILNPQGPVRISFISEKFPTIKQENLNVKPSQKHKISRSIILFALLLLAIFIEIIGLKTYR